MASISLFLYAARAGNTDQVKIGVTNNPNKRLKQVQTDCPYRVRFVFLQEWEGAWGVERRIHAMIGSRRGIGEWFTLPSDDEIHGLFAAAVAASEPDDTRRVFFAPMLRRRRTLTKEQLYDMLIAAGWTDDDLYRVLKAKVAADVTARR